MVVEIRLILPLKYQASSPLWFQEGAKSENFPVKLICQEPKTLFLLLEMETSQEQGQPLNFQLNEVFH